MYLYYHILFEITVVTAEGKWCLYLFDLASGWKTHPPQHYVYMCIYINTVADQYIITQKTERDV